MIITTKDLREVLYIVDNREDLTNHAFSKRPMIDFITRICFPVKVTLAGRTF